MTLYYTGHPPITIEGDTPTCVMCKTGAKVILDSYLLQNGHTGAFCSGCRANFEISYASKMIDPKHCSFEDVRALISDQPKTFYPALLAALVEASYKAQVWQPSGASHFVTKVEEKNGWNLK